jgi:hypothetical protein
VTHRRQHNQEATEAFSLLSDPREKRATCMRHRVSGKGGARLGICKKEERDPEDFIRELVRSPSRFGGCYPIGGFKASWHRLL